MDKYGYYKLLDISNKSSLNEIRIAYKSKAKEFHPDINKHKDATIQFQTLLEAYDTLKDDVKRKKYDTPEYSTHIYFSSSDDYELRPKYDMHEYIINIKQRECNCKEWNEIRYKYKFYDPRRLCRHLISTFTYVDDELILDNDLFIFKKLLKELYYKYKGYPLYWKDIVFFDDSVLFIGNEFKYFDIYIKNNSTISSFCRNLIFKLSKGTYEYGWSWKNYETDIDLENITFGNNNIRAIDYLVNTLNISINPENPCITLEEEYRKKLAYYNIFKLYLTSSNILKEFNSEYSINKFYSLLSSLGYIIKNKTYNKNKWILTGKGLNYGMNYGENRTYCKNADLSPEWYTIYILNNHSNLLQKTKYWSIFENSKIYWNKNKFNNLLEIIKEHDIIYQKNKAIEQLAKKDAKLKEQLKNEEIRKNNRRVELNGLKCPHCESEKIHKKDIRQRKLFRVQRYQCRDCNSIFQEKIINE